MYDFNYHRPTTLEAARKLFEQSEDGWYLAGGHTLLPSMKLRLAAPSDLIDLSRIEDLTGISATGDEVRIGACTPHDTVARSREVGRAIPALCDLAAGIGDAQVRNRGTIGGSIANNDPASDYPAGLVGLDAVVITDSRDVPADEFFTGMFETVLEPGELIRSVRFPVPAAACYVKFPNPASRYATVGVMVARTGDGVRVAVTGAGPCVFRDAAMESALSDNFHPAALDGCVVDADGLNDDMHASAAYRAHLCVVLTRKAVTRLTA